MLSCWWAFKLILGSIAIAPVAATSPSTWVSGGGGTPPPAWSSGCKPACCLCWSRRNGAGASWTLPPPPAPRAAVGDGRAEVDAAACCLHAWQHAGQRGSPRPAVEGEEEAVAVTAADAGTERGAIKGLRVERDRDGKLCTDGHTTRSDSQSGCCTARPAVQRRLGRACGKGGVLLITALLPLSITPITL